MSPSDSPVLFRRAGSGFDRRAVRDFALRLKTEITEGRLFACLLTDDRELRRLNRIFLQKDYPTDVLSFPAQNGRAIGELAISTERAAEQAREFNHSLDEELRVLMLHGVLHLLGMDHESDRGSMGRAEKKWRKHFHLPSSLIERAKR